MADYTDIVNQFVKVDQAIKDVVHEQLVILQGTNMETKVPARILGVEEEFNSASYPAFIINPLDVHLDLRRFNDERQIEDANSLTKKVKAPKQPYLATYIVSGFAQNMRVLREMQFFLASAFPVNSFVTINGTENIRVDLKSQDSNVDFPNKEFVSRMILEAWVLLDVDVTGELVKRVYNTITISFHNQDGRSAVVDTEDFSWDIS